MKFWLSLKFLSEMKMGYYISKNFAFRDEYTYDPCKYDAICASRFILELDGEGESENTFETNCIAVIIALRNEFDIVTASCDFEDRVFDETGWNWTERVPHPSLK